MSPSAPEYLSQLSVTVPDFPQSGILFRDLAPVFAHPVALRTVAEAVIAPFIGRYDVIAGVEARGFVLAAAGAALLDSGMLMIRKQGKLPGAVLGETYTLEYGEATLEVQAGALPARCRVLLVDDVLATGGTLAAAAALIDRAGWIVAGIGVALELESLGGRAALPGREIHAIQLV